MNKGLLWGILIVLSVTIAVFSVFKYLASLKEKYDLLASMREIQEEVAVLSKEKQNLLQDLEKEKQLQQKLSQDNSGLKEYLRASRDRIDRLFKETKETQEAIEGLNSQISLAKAENRAMFEEVEILKSKLTTVNQENESYKAKLSSVEELKKAIRELKVQRRKMTKDIVKIRTEIIGGNRGYLMREGKPTSGAKVRIEVIPAQNK